MTTTNSSIFFKAITTILILFGNIMSFCMISNELGLEVVLLNHKIDGSDKSIELKKGNTTLIIPDTSLCVREVSKRFAEYKPEFLRLFHPLYPNKYISEQCMLFDCVYNNRYEQVRYLLNRNVNTCMQFYHCTHDRRVALTCNIINSTIPDFRMKNLLSEKVGMLPKDRLSTSTLKPNNVELLITACKGDIEEFEKIVKNETDKGQLNIPLVILAAVLNGDVNFLKNLQNHDDYKRYMCLNSGHFLRFAITGFYFYCPAIGGIDLTEKHLSQHHFERAKKIIESKVFTLAIPHYCSQLPGNIIDFIQDLITKNQDSPHHNNLVDLLNFVKTQPSSSQETFQYLLYLRDSRTQSNSNSEIEKNKEEKLEKNTGHRNSPLLEIVVTVGITAAILYLIHKIYDR